MAEQLRHPSGDGGGAHGGYRPGRPEGDSERDQRRPALDLSWWRRWGGAFAAVITVAAAVVAIAVPGTGLGWTWAALIVSLAAGVGAFVVSRTATPDNDRRPDRAVLAVAGAGVLISLAALPALRTGWTPYLSQPPGLWWVLMAWGVAVLLGVALLVVRRPALERATAGEAFLDTAIGAVVLCIGVAGVLGAVFPSPPKPLPSPPVSGAPMGLPPPGYKDEGCFYDVTNDSNLGAAPHMILPGGRVEQHFQAVTPYVWTLSAVIGYEGSGVAPSVDFTVLEGSKVLYEVSKPVVNNRDTEVRLGKPLLVDVGKDYVFVVTNRSRFRLGFYMYAEKDSNHKPTKPANTGETFVYGEERQRDGLRTQALTGCIGGLVKEG